MPRNQRLGKQLVLEFLDYLRFKIEQDKLTLEETESIAKTIENTLNLTGTADDFASFYGKTKTNVTTVIDRYMLSKPRRMVMHSFNEFRRVVPESWLHTKR